MISTLFSICFGKLDGILNGQAAFDQFFAAEPVLDQEIGTDRFPHPVNHHQRKAGAILTAAAVAVGALVRERREELPQQPAVAAMQHHHIEAHNFEIRGGIGVVIGHLAHHGFVHLVDGNAVFADVAGGADGILVARNIHRVVGRAGVIDLHRGHRAMLFDGHGQFMKCARMPVSGMGIGDVVEGIAAVGVLPIHIGLAHCHLGKAAAGPGGVKRNALIGWPVIDNAVVAGQGRHHQPVPEQVLANLDGTE